jgi:hypothetical protein
MVKPLSASACLEIEGDTSLRLMDSVATLPDDFRESLREKM